MTSHTSTFVTTGIWILAACATVSCAVNPEDAHAAPSALAQLSSLFEDHMQQGQLEAAFVVGATLTVAYPGSAAAAAAKRKIGEISDLLDKKRAEAEAAAKLALDDSTAI